MTLEFTLGEPRVESVTKSDLLFTQGFHQPIVKVRTFNVPLRDGIKVVAYPNPVKSMLTVNIQSEVINRPLVIELTDLRGVVLYTRRMITTYIDELQFRMDGYIAGVYFLVVRDISGRVIQTIKLEKLE
jgi:hypothetical protein